MTRHLMLSALLIAVVGCGDPPAKSPSSNSSSNPSNRPLPPANQREEQGSPQFEVQSAFDRLYPLLCEYDATCEEPLLQDTCPLPAGTTPDNSQCWVVDSAKLSTCESELRGLQCQGTFENLPLSCAEAVRQCECAAGYERSFDNECLPICETSKTCPTGLLCYDGVCSEPEEGWCADDYTFVFTDEGDECHPSCEFGCEGDLECDETFNACLLPEDDEPVDGE